MKQTTLAYLYRGDEVLLLYRNKKSGDENLGKWIGLGGKFEFGETPEECMLREVKEESGLSPVDYSYRGIVTFVSGDYCEQMHLFCVTRFTGALHPCTEGELCFVKRSLMQELPMWEGDRIFLSLLESDCPFFSLKLVYDGAHLVKAILNGSEYRR